MHTEMQVSLGVKSASYILREVAHFISPMRTQKLHCKTTTHLFVAPYVLQKGWVWRGQVPELLRGPENLSESSHVPFEEGDLPDTQN